MGNKAGKMALKPKEVAAVQVGTRFTKEEIEALFLHFETLKDDTTAATPKGMGHLVNLTQFQKGLGFKGASSLFVERVYSVMFDVDGSGWIDFKKFVDGIHRLSSYETHSNKVKCSSHKVDAISGILDSFQLHNLSGGVGISREDLRRMLAACLHENDVSVPMADVDALVETTFAAFDVDGDGAISAEEYKAMVDADKSVLAPLIMNVPELIAAAKADAELAASAAGSGAAAASTSSA